MGPLELPRLIVCGVTVIAIAFGCSETPYTFFDQESAFCRREPCDCDAGSCGSADGSDAFRGAGGARGGGGTAAGPGRACESARDPSTTLERVELDASGRCIAQGPSAPLRGEPSYATTLTACEESLPQMWAIRVLDDDSLELRNEAVDLNLDVRFAASDDGTPIVLFTPHQLYNQRFNVLDGSNRTFKLVPLHAPTKCLTERGDTLVLLPCDEGLETQNFRRIACR